MSDDQADREAALLRDLAFVISEHAWLDLPSWRQAGERIGAALFPAEPATPPNGDAVMLSLHNPRKRAQL